ncbi:MAG: UDP-2,3-diacylglucosamine diphosphatase [Gammaproteobacteria bacterium]
MTTLFISDLHLSEERPDKLALFLEFLLGPARGSEALYILGDLFEVWLGDDDDTPPIPSILKRLADLQEAKVPLYIMRGNRDFLMGDAFEAKTGCTLLPDARVIDLYGSKTLLLHGDTLCTKDVEYQAFRQMVHNPEWQAQALAAPLAARRAMAKQLRKESVVAMQGKTPLIMDVDQEAVQSTMRQYGAFRLIHGHTHRPAVHRFMLGGQPAERIVLGDWYEEDSVLVCDEHGSRAMRVAQCIASVS